MNRLLKVALALIGLGAGCSKELPLTPSNFTKEYALALQSSSQLNVEVVRDLHLKVTTSNGRESTSFLDNAYKEYLAEPSAKKAVIERFVASAIDVALGDEKIARDRVVPVIKDKRWIEEMQATLISRGAKELPEMIYEEFNSDLVIVYAIDRPSNIKYLISENLPDLGIDRSELKTLACENLRRLLPKIERHGANGLFTIAAGGTYEASLLLLDLIWTDGQMDVKGDIVVAVPTRDLLLVTGSDDPNGLIKMDQMIAQAIARDLYTLTPKRFVYRNGAFSEFIIGPK
jgi:uncharacterized protein YtpQ (UPF0354 family)